MASYIENDITFDNVTTTGIKVAKNIVNTGTDLSDPSDPYIEPLINAVEIDWNNAKLGETIISTTGQLLSYMSTIAQKIENLENILINL